MLVAYLDVYLSVLRMVYRVTKPSFAYNCTNSPFQHVVAFIQSYIVRQADAGAIFWANYASETWNSQLKSTMSEAVVASLAVCQTTESPSAIVTPLLIILSRTCIGTPVAEAVP